MLFSPEEERVDQYGQGTTQVTALINPLFLS
jgi:hypothetical protein